MQYEQAKALLDQIDGCTFAGLDTLTIPTLKGGKANPMQGKVEKLCFGHRVMLFTNKNVSGYENKVRRHLEREGKNPDSFTMGKLPWGERVKDSPFITNKGEYYLQACFLEAGKVQYIAKETFRFPVETGKLYYSGDEIPKEQIIGLNERSGSEHQGLDNAVIIRTYKLDSIVALRAFRDELN